MMITQVSTSQPALNPSWKLPPDGTLLVTRNLSLLLRILYVGFLAVVLSALR